MSTTILSFPIHSKRDILRIRQRARQLAGLIGFNAREQIVFAASVFEIACEAFYTKSDLRIQIEGDSLQVVLGSVGAAETESRFDQFLPCNSNSLGREDLAWAIQELSRNTPLNLFEEYCQQNREVMQLAEDLSSVQAAAGPGNSEPGRPSAA